MEARSGRSENYGLGVLGIDEEDLAITRPNAARTLKAFRPGGALALP